MVCPKQDGLCNSILDFEHPLKLVLYTERHQEPQLYASPIDIQYTDEGVWFTAGCEAVVDPADHPEEELRVEMLG